jgi:hypothetical protein
MTPEEKEKQPVSDQPYQLAHPYFEVRADSASSGNHLVLHVNQKASDIVELNVGGITITTVRENWTRIYVLLARIVAADELVRSFQAVTPGEWTEVSA